MHPALRDALEAVEAATQALAEAAAAGDADAADAALAARAEGIDVLTRGLAGVALDASLTARIERVLALDRSSRERLAACVADARRELQQVHAAREVAERLAGPRAPARFFNERI